MQDYFTTSSSEDRELTSSDFNLCIQLSQLVVSNTHLITYYCTLCTFQAAQREYGQTRLSFERGWLCKTNHEDMLGVVTVLPMLEKGTEPRWHWLPTEEAVKGERSKGAMTGTSARSWPGFQQHWQDRHKRQWWMWVIVLWYRKAGKFGSLALTSVKKYWQVLTWQMAELDLAMSQIWHLRSS